MKEYEMNGTCNVEIEYEKCIQKLVGKPGRNTPRVCLGLIVVDLQREVACKVK
jgi:hypothetical protein